MQASNCSAAEPFALQVLGDSMQPEFNNGVVIVVDPEGVEMLQDLVVAAVNEAMRKAQEMIQSEMSKVTGGMNIPGLF